MVNDTSPGNNSAPSVSRRIVGAVSASMMLAALLAGCTADTPAPPVHESGVDERVKPGDDFFAYANGAWLAATEIPQGKQRWTARTEIDELNRQRVVNLLDDARNAAAGSMARKVADFRAARLNEGAIEAGGIAPLQLLLDRISRVRDKATLVKLLGNELRTDVDPRIWGVYNSSHVLGLSVEAGNRGEGTYVAILVQGGLGLPDREHYISTEPRSQALRARYLEYIARMLALAGFDRTAHRAERVMALESAIAQSHATREESADDGRSDNVWARADFARDAPGMDWSAFFSAARLGNQETFVAWQPAAVKGVAALVASQPLNAWQDYLRFHAVHAHAEVLPRAFAEQALALRVAVTGGQTELSRAARAIDATRAAMSDALGRMYAEQYFPAEQKARVQAIVEEVVTAFRRRVKDLKWMSPATRTVALEKLQTLYVGIGYPETWRDYSGLFIDPADAVGNHRRIAEHNYSEALARLGQRVDRSRWLIAPHKVGALLAFHQNAYDFSAALMQPPKFEPAASDAANYGAIGAIIGHDVSHFVDTLGADYDTAGRKRRWWTAADDSQYTAAATAALVDQFSNYRPLPDLGVDGKLTLIENLADLAGLVAAFDAHRRALGSKLDDKQYVRQQDRQFFIGFARGWRAKIRDDELRVQLVTDGHAPENFRIATVRNIDAWYEAFDVVPGQKLYLEPEARVRIW